MEHLVEDSQVSSNRVEMVEHRHSLWEEMEEDSHLNNFNREVKEDSLTFSLSKEDDLYIIT